MKILYIAPIRLPTEKAHGIQIMETCAALTRAGVVVELLVTSRKTPIKENPFDFYSIRDHFSITRLSTPNTVEYGRVGYLLYAIVFAFRAAFYARGVKPDVVYTRDPVSFIVCNLFRVGPLVWEVHTAHPGVPRLMMRSALGVIGITKGLVEWYRAQGVSEVSLHVAPDAVNLDAFARVERGRARASVRARLNLPQDSKVALYAGSFGLYAWKGVDVARSAGECATSVSWLFIGGGEKECEELTRDAPPNIFTLPRARREEIPSLLCGADVLLLPNKAGDLASERDTSPMKLFEYMASGVPIVASDVQSLREILDEDTAFLVRPNDPEALATGVEQALKDTEEALRRAARARSAATSYTWDARAQGILSFIDRQIAPHS